jgi:hypothetical protein
MLYVPKNIVGKCHVTKVAHGQVGLLAKYISLLQNFLKSLMLHPGLSEAKLSWRELAARP